MARITLVVSSLSGGGAERVAVNLAWILNDAGHKVTLATKGGPTPDDYLLPQDTERRVIPNIQSAAGLLNRLRSARLRSECLKEAILATCPDIVITFAVDLNVRVLGCIRDIPVVITEHNNPAMSYTRLTRRVSRRVLYPRARALVCVSEGLGRAFSWLHRAPIRVIHNSIPPQTDEEKYSLDVDVPMDAMSSYVLGCGRLVRQKGFDLLIQAFSEAVNKSELKTSSLASPWRLGLLGGGPDEEQLRALAHRCGVANRVDFLGKTQDPLAVMRRSDILVLSSRYEGFGNVLVEAMSQGVPVIATDCDFGPNEIIEHEVNGILVPPESPSELGAAIARLASDYKLRRSLAREGFKQSDRFSYERIGEYWNTLINEILG